MLCDRDDSGSNTNFNTGSFIEYVEIIVTSLKKATINCTSTRKKRRIWYLLKRVHSNSLKFYARGIYAHSNTAINVRDMAMASWYCDILAYD